MSDSTRNIPLLALVALGFTGGCNPDSGRDVIVGEWLPVSGEAGLSLTVSSNYSGVLEFYSYSYDVEVDISDAPTYKIEVKNDGDSDMGEVLRCQLTGSVLECPEPYSFRVEKK